VSVDDHLEKTRDHKLHVEGEENGCLLRCFAYGKDDPKGTKGHSHRLNGRIYQEKNEHSRYNLDFTSGENRARLESIFGRDGPRCDGGDPRHRTDACHYRAPWPNVAHHVVPINVIGKVFPKLEELELLLFAKYNVNRGLNVVILPYGHEYARAMQLPVHRGSHPAYDTQVEKMLSRIRKRIKKAEAPEREGHPELTKENVPGIVSDIEGFATRLRKVLLGGYSKARHGPSVNEFRFLSAP
jgi:hypothetical protein